ncbi:hypothetical protein DTO96_101148 [Ephemeroptericola cinctiostellae]|uniref:Uncharacterized protein n=1 Tax=Ephemeroptericola cinctiostellae TaxID=2268024 RepID=A0A345DAM9_9BURK|nr:hypothetical protein [Ephemeroptericola cinctiostellae]AXF85417.1 hypothetical protein DTO96_101148 [Ephemeroptericola cinctiostellae]
MGSPNVVNLTVDLSQGFEKLDVESNQLHAYTISGKYLGTSSMGGGQASFDIPSSLDGQKLQFFVGPRLDGAPPPSVESFIRAGAPALSERMLIDNPFIKFVEPIIPFPLWCICNVRGRLIKYVTLPDGTVQELPICNARVHVCEVDRIQWLLPKIPDVHIIKLREDILDRLNIIKTPFPPIPIPIPDPEPFFRPQKLLMGGVMPRGASIVDPSIRLPSSVVTRKMKLNADFVDKVASHSWDTLNPVEQKISLDLLNLESVDLIRNRLLDLSAYIQLNLCHFPYLWPFLKCTEVSTTMVDHLGHFQATIFHRCSDQPDLYFWVEQLQNNSWVTVYRPNIWCNVHWNYKCDSEVVINTPNAEGCEHPNYDVPEGVVLFVLPYKVGNTPIFGEPTAGAVAPVGWVRTDGLTNYHYSGLGLVEDAPFGGLLDFYHDDSYYIPLDNGFIKYYRYSYRRLGAVDWVEMNTPLARGYRTEYSDRLPTYESYQVGPNTVNDQSSLFEFRPRVPPAAAPGSTVVVREWLSGNFSEVAARWDTTVTAPPMAGSTPDHAGTFEVKIEVFGADGVKVFPSAATFAFLMLNHLDVSQTRLASPFEVVDGAFVMKVHVDNNAVVADLPQPTIGSGITDDDCGFLRYTAGQKVNISYTAAHPHDRAVFIFSITRGSHTLGLASTAPTYIETAALTAPTGSASYSYNLVSGTYQAKFLASDLVGACGNAAFAAHLAVYGKVTNGYWPLSNNASRLIAFALAT